jgi:endoglucanase
MMERLHSAARAAAPDLTLVATGGCWGDAALLQHLTTGVTDDANTIFSFHSYAPFLLTHQGASWTGNSMPHVTGLPFPPDRYSAADFQTALRSVESAVKQKAAMMERAGIIEWVREQASYIDTPEKLQTDMERPYKDAAVFAADRGINPNRVLLGEFGMIRQEWKNPFIMPAEWRIDYIRAKRALADKHGFGWAVWGYSGAFGMVQSFGGEKIPEQILEQINKP